MHFPRYTDFQVCVDWGQRLYSKRALDRVPKINLYGHVWTSGTVAIRLYTKIYDVCRRLREKRRFNLIYAARAR